ncbi:MAG: TonB-dependent receptor [Sphingobacterium sp.]
MKLTGFLIAASTLGASASTFAQVTVNARNEQIETVLKNITKQTGVRFIYEEGLLKNQKINLQVANATLNTSLDKLFGNSSYSYAIHGETVVIKVNTTDAVQNLTFSGKVIDEKGTPLVNVTVQEVGTTTGTQTDENGNFSLKVSSNSAKIRINSLGYTSQIIPYSSSAVTISLIATQSVMDEVVVVGYGSQKKINLTGAVSTVGSDVFENRMITSVGAGLQGAIPNLNIGTGDGRPGSGASFNIRGYTSLSGGSPLVLIDGVQMDPNQLNPQDVESVTVLKDAAAAAIYGGRAAYGVVLITTKSGKFNSKTSFGYSFNQAFSRPMIIPNTVNSLEYVEAYNYADRSGNLSGSARGSDVWTDRDIEGIKRYMENPIPENAVYIDPTNPSRYRYTGNTNWWKEMFPNWAPLNQHDLNFTGGSEKLRYNSSLGYLGQKGLFKAANQKYERYNANLGLEAKVTSWLDLNAKLRFNRKEDDRPAPTGAISSIFGDRISADLRPIMPIRHPDGHYAGQGNFTNPFAMNEFNGRNTYSSDDIWLTGGFKISPIKNFRVVGDLTWNAYHYNNNINIKSYLEYGAVPAGKDITNPDNAILLGPYPHNKTPFVYEGNSKDIYSAINVYAEYENTFAEKHYLKAMVGYNQESKSYNFFSAQAKNLINQDFPYLGLNNDDKPIVNSRPLDWALIGQFFRLNYIFDDRYLIEVNGRYDGSSRFAAKDRYVFSPSASIAWRLSNENFMSFAKPVVNELKVRASYGTLPNQVLDPDNPSIASLYPYIATMPKGLTSYIFGTATQSYVTAPGLVSPLFTWEKVTSKNLGLDFVLFNNQLSGSFDLYRRDTRDMLVEGQPLPAILGVGAPKRNAADLKTTGWEFEIKYSNYKHDFKYFASFNLADNKAEITRYDLNPTGQLGDRYVGQKIDEIWGYTSNGLYQSDAEANDGLDKSRIFPGTWLAGDIRFEDLNGDKKISNGSNTLADPGDQRIIGNSTARYSYGIRLGGEYKNFDLSLFLQGVGKRDAALSGSYFYAFGGSEWDVPTKNQLDYWTPENTDAYFPRARFGNGGFGVNSTRYLQNAAYLRLKNATLGYTLPVSLTERIKVQQVRFFFSAENILTFTKMFGNFDPEQLDRNSYPLSKNISFGAQIRF